MAKSSIKSVYQFSAMLVALVIAVSSCSIEKRHYRHGYSVEMNLSKKKHAQAEEERKQEDAPLKLFSKEPVLAVNDEPFFLASGNNSSLFFRKNYSQKTVKDSCDRIVLKTHVTIKGMVEKIAADSIQYRKCDSLSGPNCVIAKSQVWLIQYADGKRAVINRDTTLDEPVVTKPVVIKPVDKRKTPVLSIAAFVFGLFAFYWPCAFIALILGWVSLKKIYNKEAKFKGTGWAIAAIILGCAGIFVWMLYLLSLIKIPYFFIGHISPI